MKLLFSIVLFALVVGGCGENVDLMYGINGLDGDAGSDGKDGLPGDDGEDGDDGEGCEDGEGGLDGLDGADGLDGQDGVDGLPGPGTRTVYSGVLNSSGQAIIALGIDPDDMPVIQAWGYNGSSSTSPFGAGWYLATLTATFVGDDGTVRISLPLGSGASYRVVVVE